MFTKLPPQIPKCVNTCRKIQTSPASNTSGHEPQRTSLLGGQWGGWGVGDGGHMLGSRGTVLSIYVPIIGATTIHIDIRVCLSLSIYIYSFYIYIYIVYIYIYIYCMYVLCCVVLCCVVLCCVVLCCVVLRCSVPCRAVL